MLRQARLLTIFALVFALSVRALVPTGWMPSAEGGAFAIMPCPAAAPMPMAMVHGASHHDRHKHSGALDQHGGDCAFSPLLIAFDQAHAPAVLPPSSLIAAPLATNRAALFYKTGPPAPPPPARGPPAIV